MILANKMFPFCYMIKLLTNKPIKIYYRLMFFKQNGQTHSQVQDALAFTWTTTTTKILLSKRFDQGGLGNLDFSPFVLHLGSLFTQY